MDEYTFILQAKLQADRLDLERKQRAALREERSLDEKSIARHRHWALRRGSSRESHRESQWREQS